MEALFVSFGVILAVVRGWQLFVSVVDS